MTLDDLIGLLPEDPPPIRPGETSGSLPAVVLRHRGKELAAGGRFTRELVSIHVLTAALPYVQRYSELDGLTVGILASLSGTSVQLDPLIEYRQNIHPDDDDTPDTLEHEITIAYQSEPWPDAT